MKKLFSTGYYEQGLSFGLFILRITISIAMGLYGYHKLTHYNEMTHSDFWEKQINFLGKGGSISLSLTVFAEFFCSIFLFFGLATRLCLIPLLICTGYIVAIVDHYQIISSGEHGMEMSTAFLYFVIYFCLFLTGPGKWSIDKLISK